MKFVDLLKSRKFWALIVSIFVLVVSHFIPGFKLDETTTAGLVIIVVGYIVSVSVDPGDQQAKLKELLASRKFWGSLIALGIIICDGFNVWIRIGITKDQVLAAVGLISFYVFGTAASNFLNPIDPEVSPAQPLG